MAGCFRTVLVIASCSLWLAGCGGGGSSSDGEIPPDLSGSIAIETNTRIDRDTADEIRLGLSANNDLAENAQGLPENAAVGGYLSSVGGSYTGPASAFRYYRDDIDLYTAELLSGTRISLQVFSSPADFLANDIELPTRSVRILKSEAGALIEATEPVSATANLDTISIALPDDFEPGSYIIEVSTSAGMPFRYVLSLADATSISGFNAQYTEPAFVIDEAVVRMAPQAGSRAMAASAVTALGVGAQRHLGGDVWLMQRGRTGVRTMSGNAGVGETKATIDWVRSLGQQPGVDLAEPNYVYSSMMVAPDNDDFYSRQWALPFMQVPLAWQVAETSGAGVGIAVLDTGLFSDTPGTGGSWHPDLAANVRLLPGTMDYVSGSLDIDQEDTGLRDGNPADPGDGRAQSSNFHGTHVAGIAAAADNSEGIVGVAPNAFIYPVRVLGRDGLGSAADLIDAINWVADQPEIDVLNLSLGGLGPSELLKSAIDSAFKSGDGQLIVAAAGNAASDQATYPAAYANVVGVGAVAGDGVLAGYSNVGPSVDVVAPGGDGSRDANQDGFPDVIVSTWGTDEGGDFLPAYAALQGTSMAAPHVAGIYALMKGKLQADGSDYTPEQFLANLRAGALTRQVGPAFEYGAGLIDALAAMDAALAGNLPVTLSSSPSALQFNAAVTSAELVLNAFPEDEQVTIMSVTSSAAWLSATFDQTQLPSSSISVRVTAETGQLDAEQRYATELEITYQTASEGLKTLVVPVSLKLGASPDEKDAGRHYVLVINAEGENSGDVVSQAVVTSANGRYTFAFDDLEPGNYFLVAGTDTDNNGFICENGEACAEYPVNGLPETIGLGNDPISGVVLNTSFRRPAISALGLPRIGFRGYRVEPEKTGPTAIREYAP